jgi:hypothetical protein
MQKEHEICDQINAFIAECRKLHESSETRKNDPGVSELKIDKVTHLTRPMLQIFFEKKGYKFKYTFCFIDLTNGDIYSQSGKKSHGNIFSEYGGKEAISTYGVIVNDATKKKRLQQLEGK